MDAAHKRADKILMKKEKRINNFYDKHTADIVTIFNEFYNKHKKDFDKKLKDYNDGKITKDEYRQYMLIMTTYSSEWRTISDKMADTITNMNRSALYSIANKGLEEIYIDNYNTTIKSIGDELVGN